MKKWLLATVFFSIMLVLAACGGGSAENDTVKQTENPSSSEEVAANNNVEIIATNWDFDQEKYTVNAGEEVTITLSNEEGMHGISIDGFDVAISGDGKATFTPEEPGEYTIRCSIPCGQGHADMTSTLVVK